MTSGGGGETPGAPTPAGGTPAATGGAGGAGTPGARAGGGAPVAGTPGLSSLAEGGESPATPSPPASTTTPVPSALPSGKVNCSGYWAPCSVSCGTGTQTYTVTTPAAGGGSACKDSDGTAVSSGQTKPCTGPPCGVDCVGDWVKSATTDSDGWGTCSATCGSGTQTRTYKITTQQQAGGRSCPKADGATETRACPNLPVCAVAVNCVGHWGEWSGCSAGCGGGTQTRTYYVDTPAANGGTACPKTNGATESQACNTTPCCSAATTGGWYDVGGVICTGSSSPDPYIYQSRAVTFPANPAGSATAQACGITVAQVRKTAGPDPAGNKCPDRAPVGGTCSSGNAWDLTNGCTVLPATKVPTAGTCSAGTWFADTPTIPGATRGYPNPPQSFDHRYGWSVYASDGTKYLHRYDGSQYSGGEQGTYVIGNATSKGGFTRVTAVPDVLKGPGCYEWIDAKQPGDIPNQRWEQRTMTNITCPSGYSPSADKKKCNAPASAITGLTCDSSYFTQNLATNKCVAK